MMNIEKRFNRVERDIKDLARELHKNSHLIRVPSVGYGETIDKKLQEALESILDTRKNLRG